MDLQKLNVKFFVAGPDAVPLTDFIEVFHGWIQATDGVYHNVADYSHMKAGPGIVLIANQANVSIDESGGRRGLLVNQKSRLSGSNQEKFRAVFRAALENCRKLEAEPALRGRLRFAPDEALIFVNDRLSAINTPDSFAAIRSDVEEFAQRLFGAAAVVLDRDDDPRRRLEVRIKSSAALDLLGLLQSLKRN